MKFHPIHATFLVAAFLCLGASYRTQNFLVTAPTAKFAKQVGDNAEAMRRDLAIEWLGKELPRWHQPCPITVTVGPTIGAGGATSFMFDRGVPFGWRMSIQGSAQRILDSVLPHEVTHTIFATHFGRPLPRWADEGACTTVEHVSERRRQQQFLVRFLTTGRGIAFNKMFAMKEYPSDILPLYSQGYSLARYLIDQGGRRKFIQYVGDGMKWNNWTAATKKHYGFKDLSELQVTWLDWVRRGCPEIRPEATLIAKADEIESGSTLVTPVSNSNVRNEDNASDSWYARQRDAAKVNTSAPQQDQARSTPTTSFAPPNDISRDQSLARPQPPTRPQQTILEWSRPPGHRNSRAPNGGTMLR